MNKYSRALNELQGRIPDTLYNIIDARWQAAIRQDKEFIDYTLKHLQPESSEEEIEDAQVNAKSFLRSKKRLTRMLICDTESVQKGTILIKKSLGLIPEVEEKDEEDEDDTPDKLKGEDFPEGVKPTDLESDNKYLYNDPVNTKPIDILNDDDIGNVVNNDTNNVNVVDIDVQMDDPQEKQDVNNEGERETDKSSSEQPVNAQSIGTQTPPISVTIDTNVNDAINDSQKDMVEEKKVEEALTTEQNMEMQPPPIKEHHVEIQLTPVTTKTQKEQTKTGKEKIEDEKIEKKEKTDNKDREKKKKTLMDDDDDEDFVSIKGPIDMDSLSSSELMEITTAMQSCAHKKRLKEHKQEAKTTQTIVKIL